jgi:hypothetical protein
MQDSYSFDKILNLQYYKSLLQEFAEKAEFNSSFLPMSNFIKINLSFVQKATNRENGFDIIIKIPKCINDVAEEFYAHLYLLISNGQFYENYSNPILNKGQKVIEKNGKRMYEIFSIKEGLYDLREIIKENFRNPRYPTELPKRTYQNILKNFLIIRRKMKKDTIQSYLRLFSKLNNLDHTSDLIPTEFGLVSIIIGQKTIWENFKDRKFEECNLWKSIPSQYISRDGTKTDTLGISPLIYFTSSYQIAYQEILKKNIQVTNIILFNDGFDELQQIISGKFQYGFRILGICNSPIEDRTNTLKYWEWHKEEIKFIDSL